MRVIVVGAGPAGLTLAAALAPRGFEVLAVDRDPGPGPDGSWRRRGVMQFEHAHGFRPQVADLLAAEWPDALREWHVLGAERRWFDEPDGRAIPAGIRSRRSVYERALRAASARVDGLARVTGTVSGLIERAGRVSGVLVDDRPERADLVVDAAGRGGRVLRAPVRGTRRRECAITYATRTYRRHPDAPPGPLSNPIVWGGTFPGYQAMVFPHEDRHLSVVILRSPRDPALAPLRHVDAFDEACRHIPAIAAWTDPRHAEPTGPVLVGAALRNEYRPQLRRPGLVALGDAVATTTPTAGRGVALCSMQIRALLDLVDDGADPATIASPFGRWCDEHLRPWVDDHIAEDAETARRLRGADLDLRRPLTSRAIVDAGERDSRIATTARGFLAMTALPASLRPAEPLARAVYRSGWRPALADGPSSDELAAIIRRSRPAAEGRRIRDLGREVGVRARND